MVNKIILTTAGKIPSMRPGSVWIYAGVETGYRDCRSRLDASGASPAFSVEQFERMVAETRGPFRKWLDEIHTLYGDDPAYWAMEEYSGHPMTTTVFQEICLLRMVKHAAERANADLLVVCGYEGLVMAIESCAAGLNIPFEKAGSFGPGVMRAARAPLSHGYHFFFTAAVFVLARLIGPGVPKPGGTDILTDFCLHGPEVDLNGTKDRYVGEIGGWLAKRGYRVIPFPVLACNGIMDVAGVFRKLKGSGKEIIFQERLLGTGDLVKAFLWPFDRPEIKNIPAFEGMDVSKIVASNAGNRRFAWASVDARLRYMSVGILKKKGFSPKLLISWDESQIIDRCCYRGFRDHLPKTELAGVRAVQPLPNWTAMAPSAVQGAKGVQPDTYFVSGAITSDYLMECDPSAEVKVAPIPRFFHLLSAVKEGLEYGGEKTGNVLLLLPTFKEWALEIIGLAASSGVECRFLVKAHPDLGREKLEPELSRRGVSLEKVRFVDGNLVDLFRQVDAVLSRQSATIVEAVSAGLPVIEVTTPYSFNQSPIDGMPKEMWKRTYDREGLVAALKWALGHPLSSLERKRVGYEAAKRSFCPFNDESMESYIPKTDLKPASVN